MASGGKVIKVGDKLESHHLLPQEFIQDFERAGLNIEDFRYNLTVGDHRLTPKGVHTGAGKGGDWSNGWREFFRLYQSLEDPEPIFRKLIDM